MNVSLAIYGSGYSQGRIQDFLKGGSENLKKGVWSASPEAIGICIVKYQNHTLCMNICLSEFLSSNQVSVAS